MSDRDSVRAGATAAVAGAVVLFIGTFLHPADADPNDAVAAFTEYAADQLWVASHLMQLLGMIFIVGALIQLSRILSTGGAGLWAALGRAGAIASLGAAAATQAVDGVALKVMVDNWAAATEPEKMMIFQAAYGVRQIEIGLASMTALLFGLTVSLYGIALIVDGRLPGWLGWLALIGGIPISVAGVVMAYTGFSALAMAINMSSSFLIFVVWMIALGVIMWRHSESLGNSDAALIGTRDADLQR